MSSRYEFWLLDDNGRRLKLLINYAFFSYSRSVDNIGTFQIGFQYDIYKELINTPIFKPDWRVDVWRSPGYDFPMRREQTYLLRKYSIYTRDTDNVQMIILYGRDPKDLLSRRYILQPGGYTQTLKNDYIDDMMKEIVAEQMLYDFALDADATSDNNRAFPRGEFTIQGDLSLGPIITQTFPDRNVLDVLQELSRTSKQLYNDNSLLYRKIYFDLLSCENNNIEEILDEENPRLFILDEEGKALLDEIWNISNTNIGFCFVIYADLYGEDRTTGVIYSVENNNLESPYYSKTHIDEINAVIVKGYGRGDSRPWDEVRNDAAINMSRWNRMEAIEDASTEPDPDQLADYGYGVLYNNEAKEEITTIFLNSPGSKDTPRSLYGVDWDLGDLLPVQYAGFQIDVEVSIVYVAKNEQGEERITGRNNVVEGV